MRNYQRHIWTNYVRSVCPDPNLWTELQVTHWLIWTVREFSLSSVDFSRFQIGGRQLCTMGKERFLQLAPDFVGDILWEHLELLQRGVCMKLCRLTCWKELMALSINSFIISVLFTKTFRFCEISASTRVISRFIERRL